MDAAVSIHAVERFLGDLALEQGWVPEITAKPTGKPYRNAYVGIWRFRDGRIRGLREYYHPTRAAEALTPNWAAACWAIAWASISPALPVQALA